MAKVALETEESLRERLAFNKSLLDDPSTKFTDDVKLTIARIEKQLKLNIRGFEVVE